MTHDAIIKVSGVRFKDYCEGLIANTFDMNAKKVCIFLHLVISHMNICTFNRM